MSQRLGVLSSWIYRALLPAVAVMAASAQPYAYVANGASPTYSTINVSNSSATQSPQLGGAVGGIAITPDGSTVYASLLYVNSVTAVSTSSNTLLATIGVGASPGHVTVSPNAALVYVVDQASNQISVISTASKTVTATIGVGARPNSVAFSPDGTRAYVTNLWASTISVIDTSTNTVVNTWATGAGPNGVAVTPDGQHIYVSCQTSNTVIVHDTSGNIVKTIAGFTFPVAVSITPDGTRAYVVNQTAMSVSILNTFTNSVVGSIGVGSYPTWVALSADGTQAYVTNEYSYNLSVISTSSNSVLKTIPSGGFYPIVVAVPAANQGPPPTCTFTATPVGSLSFTSAGGSVGISVTASAPSCSWTASGPGWAGSSVNPTSWTGNGTTTLNVGLNNSTQTLNGSITVAGTNFNVTQSGTTITVSSVSATAGTPQSATVNTAFATALQATVKDSGSNPMSGVTVTFTAPSSGASALFGASATATAVTNASGQATAPTLTANSTAGSYTVTASAAGVATAASFNLTNTAAVTGGSDLALGKTATQSSTLAGYGPAGASNAVDGNTDGIFSHNSVSHTNMDANAWWQVDLVTSATIGSITIWNRTDCCLDRLSDYWVFVSNTPFGATDTPLTLQGRAGTWSSHQTSYPNPSATIAVNAQGRYVRVQLSGANYLNLAEVQVFGSGSGPTTYGISGQVTLAGAGLNGVTMTLSGSQNGSMSTSGTGNYSFTGLAAAGNYTVTPSLSGYSFTPPSQTFNNLSANQTANFTATAVSGNDLALGRPATQSSTLAGYGPAAASNAVDGNTDGNFYHGSVSHTNGDANAWWQVDLGTSFTVTSVSIWNRMDCCSDRLSDYWVFVSNTPFGPSDTPATLQGRAGTWSSHQTSYPNPSATIAVNAPGRYVRVQLSGANYLSLAEVQVFGQ